MTTARALEIITQVKELLLELNSFTKDLPLQDRCAHDIFEYYFFGCSGSPTGRPKEIIPVVPKIPVWPDRPRGNNFEFSRIGMRNRGTPEPMIWELYPPQNPTEREEMARRLAAAAAKAKPKLSPEDALLQRAAMFAAKREKRTAEELLADPVWVQQQKELQAMVKQIKIVY